MGSAMTDTDTAELVARFRAATTQKAHNERMRKWDYVRKVVADGSEASLPRDIIETEFFALEEDLDAAADRLTALERELGEALADGITAELVEHFFEPEDTARERPSVLARALSLAVERGGQTCPVSSYDITRAREQITSEVKETDRVKRELTASQAEVETLRAELAAAEAYWGGKAPSADPQPQMGKP